MLATKLIDEEIARHLDQLNIQQKQIVLVVLKTMSGQNGYAETNMVQSAKVAAKNN